MRRAGLSQAHLKPILSLNGPYPISNHSINPAKEGKSNELAVFATTALNEY